MIVRGRKLRTSVATGLLLAALPLAPVPAQATPPPTATGDLAPSYDFNGDGFADLAIGVPGEALGKTTFAGAVNVVYGGPRGLTAAGNQLWSQANRGVKGHPERADGFGGAVAGGDFNGDGRDDLAVGVSGENSLTGAVNVLYGSPRGLSAYGDQFWSQASAGVPGAAEHGDEFGGSLSTGNFNGDRYADLAVGSPQEAVGATAGAGSVTILYGSAKGLRSAGSTSWTQASGGLGTAGRSNLFGESLAVGDVDRDGFADLAVGAPSRSYGADSKGAVLLFLGSTGGLTAKAAQVWTQDSPDVPDMGEAADLFGQALSFGDFDGDGHADLAVGAPGEGFGNCAQADEPGQPPLDVPCALQGAVHVLLGGNRGLTARGSQFWHKGETGLPGVAEEGDAFGDEVVAGNFDGDSRWELAISSRDVKETRSAGAVYVLPGAATGPTATRLQVWTQDSPGVPGASELGDNFGIDLAVGAFAGGVRHALAAAVPQEQLASYRAAGQVIVLYGSAGGLTATGSQSWSQATPRVRGGAESGDRFGSVDGQGRSTG